MAGVSAIGVVHPRTAILPAGITPELQPPLWCSQWVEGELMLSSQTEQGRVKKLFVVDFDQPGAPLLGTGLGSPSCRGFSLCVCSGQLGAGRAVPGRIVH